MIYDFDTHHDRLHSDSEKWRRYPPDVLPMWVADMDFQSAPPIQEALVRRVAHGIFGYPTDNEDLVSILVQRMAERYKWNIAAQDICLLPGVIVGFNLACQSMAVPGEAVIVQPPVYPPFLSAPHNGGLLRSDAVLVQDAHGHYTIDFDAFEAVITPSTRMFILCNPHNPVGRVFTQYELERLAEICLRHNLVICSDEIHCDLVYPGHTHIPIASLDPQIAKNTITLMAPSKTFNIPGLQCSFSIIPDPDLRDRFNASRKGLVSWVNLMGQAAALAAYTQGQPWLSELLSYLESNRDFLYDFVKDELPGVKMIKPEGTYLAWLDCRQAGIPGNPANFFENHARVGLNDGEHFGAGGAGFVRLNFACPRTMLEEGLQRMKRALLENRIG
jgi:cysteine-S-conjugate beta-lyase